MQQPNRLGLGLRPPLPSYGQGPSIGSMAQQQQMHQFVPPQAQKHTTLFIGSISGGIADSFLTRLLSACGTVKSFKRLITPANKPQGFGFAEFEEPDGALRAMSILNGVELPALEDGCANKKLLVKADEKTKMFLDVYMSQRMKTDADEAQQAKSKSDVDALVAEINAKSQDAAANGLLDKERYVIPPHLHDLHEADLPETQRGLVISEIAQFRERAAKREREKAGRDNTEGRLAFGRGSVSGSFSGVVGAPSGPKARDWGKQQQQQQGTPEKGHGKGPQGYSKPVGFVKAENDRPPSGTLDSDRKVSGKRQKTDEELEIDRKETRKREEEISFRDRERRYEPRERTRIQTLERSIARIEAMKKAEDKDRVEIRSRLGVWDDDESDEMFYVDRAQWRGLRQRRLVAEEAADTESQLYEEQEVENLRRESEAFLARQMDEMQALAEEQRKAGLLLDDGAPVKLNVSLAPAPEKEGGKERAAVFGQEEDEEEGQKKRKVQLVKLDFSVAESGEKVKERLEMIKASVPHDKENLFKAKVRWDGLSDLMIDRKLEPLIKRLMVKHLGELMDDDLIMFVVEHLKDHKTPQKLAEGLEQVLEEEAVDFAISVWRQIIFESVAYGEGLHTERMMVD